MNLEHGFSASQRLAEGEGLGSGGPVRTLGTTPYHRQVPALLLKVLLVRYRWTEGEQGWAQAESGSPEISQREKTHFQQVSVR